jgi:large subunit ribosomal protein L4
VALPVYNTKGEETEKIELNKEIFSGEVNKPLLHQAVRMYEANKRSGTASTKTRAYVRGGGKKPWRQKGTGRARAGSIRSPLWRGGGIVFGPHPRDYYYSIPNKAKRLALISALNAKVNDNEFTVINELNMNTSKTKDFASMLKDLNLHSTDRLLILVDKLESNIIRSSRNIPGVKVKGFDAINSYDILTCHRLIITKAGLEKLTERILKTDVRAT